jgi:hypothetical protein
VRKNGLFPLAKTSVKFYNKMSLYLQDRDDAAGIMHYVNKCGKIRDAALRTGTEKMLFPPGISEKGKPSERAGRKAMGSNAARP